MKPYALSISTFIINVTDPVRAVEALIIEAAQPVRKIAEAATHTMDAVSSVSREAARRYAPHSR